MSERPSRHLLRTAVADSLRLRVRRAIEIAVVACASVGLVLNILEVAHHPTPRAVVAMLLIIALGLCGVLGLAGRVTWTPTAFVLLVVVANVTYLLSFGPWFGLGAAYILAIALSLMFGTMRRARLVAVALVSAPLAIGVAAHVGLIHPAPIDLHNSWTWARATLAAVTALIGVALLSHFTVRQLVLERRAIEALLQRERTERAERDRVDDELVRARRSDGIAQLAAEVGADIGAALAIIRTRASLLAAELHTPDAQESLGDILEVASNAGGTMRQLTAFAPSAPSSAPERGDGAAAIRALHKLVHRVLPPTVTLEISAIDRALVPIATGDLARICANLVLNARDAIETAGRITVTLTRDATHAVIEVRDDGAGMDAATLGRLFQPFFTTKQVGRGTGLGLATTKILVERAHGTIAVTSTVGAGTCFTIRLPLVADEPGDVPALHR